MQLDELQAQQQRDSAEAGALTTGIATLTLTRGAAAERATSEQALAAGAAAHAVDQYSRAVEQHLAFQAARLQLLLRQLTFCSAELCSAPLAWLLLVPSAILQAAALMPSCTPAHRSGDGAYNVAACRSTPEGRHSAL